MHKNYNPTFYEKIRANGLLLLAWLVLFAGFILTGIFSYQVKVDTQLRERQRFDLYCREIQVKIETRLVKQKQMLLSGVAMFESSENVTRDEWQRYVKRLSLSRDLDGVQALGFSLWLKPEQLLAHEERVHKEGFLDYHVKPAGKRDAYTAIIYIEPFLDRNLRAFGYDMYSESVRHAAMSRSVDEDTVTLSGKVILLQETETDVQAGTLMYAPVFQKNKPLNTPQQRWDALFGWVYSPFRMTDLLRNIVLNALDVNDGNLQLSVYDGEEMTNEHLLYQSSSISSDKLPVFSSKRQMQSFGTTWTLYFEQFDSFEKKFGNRQLWIVASTGTFISLLLFFLLRSHFLLQKNATRIALELTKQVREKEAKLASTNADLLQFTTVSAHHLQEPARRLVSFVQRLRHELRYITAENEDVAISLHFIEQSALRQRALVRDIQRYLAATEPRATVKPVFLTEILEKVLKYHADAIHKTQASVDYGTALPAVLIDRPRLYDIFNILLNNALTYQQPDCPPQIRIYCKQKGARIFCYVEDNGIGISAQYRERVFWVFERLQVNDNQESTGVGLAIVKRIVESCNGSVELLDTAGGGTTVVFDLPAYF